jgi:uncharacterized protein
MEGGEKEEAEKGAEEAQVTMEPGEEFAARLRGFGAVGILAIAAIALTGNMIVGPMIVVPIGGILALAWVWLSRTPWGEIGYARPESWARTVAGGIVFGVALKFAMKAVVMPLLGADPVNRAFQFMAGNRALLPAAAWASLAAGFAEETTFRGYLFERMGKLLGTKPWAKTVMVVSTAAFFGAAHYILQGRAGVEQATIVGLTFGSIFAITGRLWMLMIAHAAFDLTAFAMIYGSFETRVAHLVFK